MPVSEDELPVQMGAHRSGMSKAEQRKSNKPIMEKRRRARINHCLNELKTLILDAMKKDPARHSKLEKADILEMTVKHLQQIQRQQLATAVATDPSVLMRFKSGFDECAAEVNRYISRLEGVDSGVKQRLAAHLHRCVSSIQQASAFPHQNVFSLAQNCDKTSLVLPNVPSIPGDVNNNSNQSTAERIQIPSGLHLIPSRLPTGELALLVPNSNHMTTFLNAPHGATFQFPHSVTMGSILSPTLAGNISNHTSAFTAVGKNQEYPSPTSTADVIKKEPPLENDHSQNYISNYKVTETKDEGLDQLLHEPSKYTFGMEPKVTQRASSSFQRTVADSTTSFLQAKDNEIPDFKPFHVDIPNSHLKAHISISEHFDGGKTIHQKPNPNFTLNPNGLYQKSPYKLRALAETLPGKPEKSLSLSMSSNTAKPVQGSPKADCSSSERFQSNGETDRVCRRASKRPLPTASPDAETASPSSSESPGKAPRISLNVTLTDDQSKNDQTCKRISVIVEDSSKSSGREDKSEVTVNVSAQKDMWRPW